jgi:hypothetical protein
MLWRISIPLVFVTEKLKIFACNSDSLLYTDNSTELKWESNGSRLYNIWSQEHGCILWQKGFEYYKLSLPEIVSEIHQTGKVAAIIAPCGLPFVIMQIVVSYLVK